MIIKSQDKSYFEVTYMSADCTPRLLHISLSDREKIIYVFHLKKPINPILVGGAGDRHLNVSK